MMKMITAVVMVDGRCRFIKLHELSTEVVFLICSATSFVGEGWGVGAAVRPTLVAFGNSMRRCCWW